MWYQAYSPNAPAQTHRVVVCYAESNDGLNWTKPKLDLFSFGDIKKTNIVMIGAGWKAVNYECSVVVDADDLDPDRKYKMLYWDFEPNTEGTVVPGLWAAFSPDGIHWKKHHAGPQVVTAWGLTLDSPPFQGEGYEHANWNIPGASSDVIDVAWDPVKEVYMLYTKGWTDSPTGSTYWKRCFMRSQSKDFVRWTQPEMMLAPDEGDYVKGHGPEIHGAPVFYHKGIYFALLQKYKPQVPGGPMPAELAISRDGLNFKRTFRDKDFIPVTNNRKKFDDGCLWTNCSPVILHDEIRFYYGAYSEWDVDLGKGNNNTGIGIARIKLDRFASVKPIEKIGQITLRPIDLTHISEITINADASGGNICPEILDHRGYRVKGFEKENAIAISSDSLSSPVKWSGKKLRDLPSGKYMLRLHLEDASIFAVAIK